MKNKCFRGMVAALVMCSFCVSTAYAAPDSDEIKKEKEAVQSEVNLLQKQLTEVLVEIDELEQQLVDKGQEVVQVTQELRSAEKKEKEQYEAMKLRIQYMYENSKNSDWEEVLKSGSISELLSRVEYMQKFYEYDRDLLEKYKETKKEISALKEKLEKEQAELEKKQQEFTAKKESLDATLEEKKEKVQDLERQFQEAVQAAAEEARKRNAETSSDNYSYNGTGDTSVAQAIVSAAYGQLGTPYVWGGTKPNVGLDCSGLTQYCHGVAGISIPRTSGPQGAGGKAVSDPRPGDIVCYSGHVGIYIGNGKMIHAPQPGDVVKIQSVYGNPWYRRYW